MRKPFQIMLWARLGTAFSTACYAVAAQQVSSGRSGPDSRMGFFVSSTGVGKGGDLGGIDGADRYCQQLAAAAGAGKRRWRAYLSAPASKGRAAVNARDRIGLGPWANYDGELVARNLEELHETAKTLWEISKAKEGNENNVSRVMALTEKGGLIETRDGPGNSHGILTGSRPDGTAYRVGRDLSCNGFTTSRGGAVQVGHLDRAGEGPNATSWNSAEALDGCNAEALGAGGSAGLLYCFAEH